MTTASGIGIGIGIGVVIGFGFAFVFLAGMNQDTPVLENIPSLVEDEARLAQLVATYNDDLDRLVIAIILTDADGEFTKADGIITLFILNDRGTEVYSGQHNFTKDDFLTWNNPYLGKQKGAWITIDQGFYSGNHDVYAVMALKSGALWDKLHASFYSLD